MTSFKINLLFAMTVLVCAFQVRALVLLDIVYSDMTLSGFQSLHHYPLRSFQLTVYGRGIDGRL